MGTQRRLARRVFLAQAAAIGSAAAGRGALCARPDEAAGGKSPVADGKSPAASVDSDTLDRQRCLALRDETRAELFDRLLPFWDRHGIDHEHGGFICALDYDGTRRNTNKFHWHQGRGIWVYSYLYNHFGRRPEHLDVARQTVAFLQKHSQTADGWWPEVYAQDGSVLRPFQGDVYGMFSAAEGLQEYAVAAGDDAARQQARDLLAKLWERVSSPDYDDIYAPERNCRVLGVWMYVLQACTQYLRRWPDADLERFAEASVKAIMEGHFNPGIGLVNEFRAFDFSPLPNEADKCQVGHCLQAFWMVIDEGLRRNDPHLVQLCIERTRRHLEVGWDHVFGGLCEWVNVDQFEYAWGPQKLAEQVFDLKMVGEHNYLKTFWALNETMLVTLLAHEQGAGPWSARYFNWAYRLAMEKYSRRAQGQATYLLATDRRMELVPESTRQDNYHPLRRMMRNLRSLERLLAAE